MVLFCFGIALALEPPTKEQIEDYRQKGTLAARIANAKALGNHLVSERLVERSQHRIRQMFLQNQGLSRSEIDQILAPPPVWRGMPTSGTVKILALLIAFSDYPESNIASSIESKLFGDGSGSVPYESLRNYYRRSSYDKLEIQGNVLGWYSAAYPRSDVPQTTQGRQNLIKAALDYYDALGHDFTQYDNDGDGAIDYLVVIWTGPDNGWGNFWWGYMTTFTDTSYRLDGKRLDTYSWQWEARPYPGTFNPRVVMHETGHALGLPDYYDYDDTVGPNGGVGNLDMMDGNWGDHNCFSKFLLDWITPTVYKVGVHALTLNPSGTSEDAIIAMPGALQGDQFGEFFIVQNRYRTANDTTYPNDGLLIWHVDARLNPSGSNFLYNNSYTEHKLLRLMEADGLEEIETGDGEADGGDYYVAGKEFDTNTTPNSKRYNETATGVKINSISTSGNLMSFIVSIPNRAVDFDMDGESDILWQHTDGTLAIWFMEGTTVSSGSGGVGVVPSVWETKGIGDFDGDGKADILWQHADGMVAIWFMEGTTVSSGSGGVGVVPSVWEIKGIGDFDGDGKADIFWQHTDGTVALWLMDGLTISSVGVPGVVPSAWQIKGIGDFDRDGKADILWQHTDGTVALWLMDGLTISSVGVPGVVASDWQIKGVGDFDGDGEADILWQHSASGTVALWLMDGLTISSVGVSGAVGSDWQIKE
jgi:M6 family metalloprotease-like protein